jgi:hypothetical protein
MMLWPRERRLDACMRALGQAGAESVVGLLVAQAVRTVRSVASES